MDAAFNELIDAVICAAVHGKTYDLTVARVNLESAIAHLARPAAAEQIATASPAQGDAGQWQSAPREGILHHGLRDLINHEAAEALKAIEEQQQKRQLRLDAELQRGMFKPSARSCDMGDVADAVRYATVMSPKHTEFLG